MDRTSSPWLTRLALVLSTYSILLGLYTFIFPHSAASLYGLDIRKRVAPPDCQGSEEEEEVAALFVAVFGGRSVALGVAVVALYYQRMYRAMGTILLCCALGGVVDVVVCGFKGTDGKAVGHAIGLVIMTFLGWRLQMQSPERV